MSTRRTRLLAVFTRPRWSACSPTAGVGVALGGGGLVCGPEFEAEGLVLVQRVEQEPKPIVWTNRFSDKSQTGSPVTATPYGVEHELVEVRDSPLIGFHGLSMR